MSVLYEVDVGRFGVLTFDPFGVRQLLYAGEPVHRTGSLLTVELERSRSVSPWEKRLTPRQVCYSEVEMLYNKLITVKQLLDRISVVVNQKEKSKEPCQSKPLRSVQQPAS